MDEDLKKDIKDFVINMNAPSNKIKTYLYQKDSISVSKQNFINNWSGDGEIGSSRFRNELLSIIYREMILDLLDDVRD